MIFSIPSRGEILSFLSPPKNAHYLCTPKVLQPQTNKDTRMARYTHHMIASLFPRENRRNRQVIRRMPLVRQRIPLLVNQRAFRFRQYVLNARTVEKRSVEVNVIQPALVKQLFFFGLMVVRRPHAGAANLQVVHYRPPLPLGQFPREYSVPVFTSQFHHGLLIVIGGVGGSRLGLPSKNFGCGTERAASTEFSIGFDEEIVYFLLRQRVAIIARQFIEYLIERTSKERSESIDHFSDIGLRSHLGQFGTSSPAFYFLMEGEQSFRELLPRQFATRILRFVIVVAIVIVVPLFSKAREEFSPLFFDLFPVNSHVHGFEQRLEFVFVEQSIPVEIDPLERSFHFGLAQFGQVESSRETKRLPLSLGILLQGLEPRGELLFGQTLAALILSKSPEEVIAFLFDLLSIRGNVDIFQ
mmetsp:Transcript_18749/g.40794  ORF Transcript_18749/g.40794 Transcript_18749/m.40794 type:complete len:413 (-) Transcript_18749:307-1545(-)